MMRFMKEQPPALLPLLRSRSHGEMLAWLYLHPESEYSTTDLARLVGVSQTTVSREADRLVDAGLVAERRHGRLRLLRAAAETVVTRPLTELLAVTFGPLPVLTDALRGVRGIDEAHIYGSWAARYHGQAGPVPRDVDVLVVGDADEDEDELFESARGTEARLGREVNIRRVSAARWREPPADDAFLASLRSRPLIRLNLDGATTR
jgi:DNA-binding transcriptional ArsR family regulator